MFGVLVLLDVLDVDVEVGVGARLWGYVNVPEGEGVSGGVVYVRGEVLVVKLARHMRGKDEERESRRHAVRARVWGGNEAFWRYVAIVEGDGRIAEADRGIRFARYAAGTGRC